MRLDQYKLRLKFPQHTYTYTKTAAPKGISRLSRCTPLELRHNYFNPELLNTCTLNMQGGGELRPGQYEPRL